MKSMAFHHLKDCVCSAKPASTKAVFDFFFLDGQDDDPVQGVANDARNSVVDRVGTWHVSLRLMVIYSARIACRII